MNDFARKPASDKRACGMRRDANSWQPCGAPRAYAVQIDGGHWYEMCPACTAWCRAAYSGVTGVRQVRR